MNQNPTHKRYSAPESGTTCSRTPQYGPMCERLMDESSLEKWMLSLPDSHVSHSPLLACNEEKMMSEICGQIPSGLYGRWEKDSSGYCLKTPQACFTGLKEESLTFQPWPQTFPSQGFIYNLKLFQLTMSQRHTSENVFGLWRTPTTNDAKNNAGPAQFKREGHNLNVQVVKWPTPRASDIEGGIVQDVQLENGHFFRENAKGVRWGVKLRDAVNLTDQVNEGDRLNPDFAEYLMGLPAGWTSLEPMDPNAWEEWLTDITAGTFWDTERSIPRVAQPHEQRNARLKALGNGIVPLCLIKLFEREIQ